MSVSLYDQPLIRDLHELLGKDPYEISDLARAAKVAADNPKNVTSLLTC
jgi:hypothetical protein